MNGKRWCVREEKSELEKKSSFLLLTHELGALSRKRVHWLLKWWTGESSGEDPSLCPGDRFFPSVGKSRPRAFASLYFAQRSPRRPRTLPDRLRAARSTGQRGRTHCRPALYVGNSGANSWTRR